MDSHSDQLHNSSLNSQPGGKSGTVHPAIKRKVVIRKGFHFLLGCCWDVGPGFMRCIVRGNCTIITTRKYVGKTGICTTIFQSGSEKVNVAVVEIVVKIL